MTTFSETINCFKKSELGVFPIWCFNMTFIICSVWGRQWQPTLVLLPGKSHGRRNLVGCSPWGREELDTTERLHFPLSCIGEGNGNPLQVLAWRIPGMAEPGELPSMGSHRVGHNWSDLAVAAATYKVTQISQIYREQKVECWLP